MDEKPYVIVRKESLELLEESVCDYIQKGYVPYQGIVVYSPWGRTVIFCQAMILNDSDFIKGRLSRKTGERIGVG